MLHSNRMNIAILQNCKPLESRDYFLDLQNSMKSLEFLPNMHQASGSIPSLKGKGKHKQKLKKNLLRLLT